MTAPPTLAPNTKIATLTQYTGVLAVLAVLVAWFGITQSPFLTLDNLVNVAETNAVLLIAATGLTFVMLVGGIDLSIGGMTAFTAVLLWQLLATGLPGPLAALLAVLAAFLTGGLVNGGLIGKAGLSFLVVTIGSSSILRGVAQVSSGGQSQTVYSYPIMAGIGSSRVLGIPVTVWIAALVFTGAVLVLRYTGFGRMIYATGGNPEAARLAGIPTAGVRVAVYTICGGLAGIAAVLDAARTTSASPNAGLGLELVAGAAVLLGGTSFMGGRGSLLGTLLGVIFLGVLSNGITLAGVSSFWTNVVSGAVLIAAIALDRLRLRGERSSG
ncbi:ABC transporter permease [Nonomuraea sp. LPB2021202275-12-8]|uniref:ABC transporter permease n=1 Tax=Nonomuraea sp. LPB2021202275-12-8 TaxID=3120159 RepID=UPI00300C56D2